MGPGAVMSEEYERYRYLMRRVDCVVYLLRCYSFRRKRSKKNSKEKVFLGLEIKPLRRFYDQPTDSLKSWMEGFRCKDAGYLYPR